MMDHRATESASAPIGHPAWEDASPGQIEYVEKLSLHEQFRLVEIAHKTSSTEIKSVALQVLRKYLNPLVMFVPNKD